MKPRAVIGSLNNLAENRFISAGAENAPEVYAKLGNLKTGERNPALLSWFFLPIRHKGCAIDTICTAERLAESNALIDLIANQSNKNQLR